MTETIQMEISKDILAALKVGIQDFTQYVRLVTAVACFQDKKLSLGKAAELTGCNRWVHLMIFTAHNPPLFDT